jgi:hypothetical protein
LHSDFEGQVGRVDAGDTGEAGIEEELFVGYATGNEHNGDVMLLGALKNAKGKFAHEGLAVGRAFASNHKVGILQQVVETDGV